jgi:hypothetical protein
MSDLSRLLGWSRPGDFDDTPTVDLEQLLTQAERDGDGKAAGRYEQIIARRRLR